MSEGIDQLYNRLTSPQHRAFIAAYFGLRYDKQGNEQKTKLFNATQAARDAGYQFPKQEGYRLKRHPVISQVIERIMSEMTMPVPEILARLGEHATGDIGDFIDDNGDVKIGEVKTSGHLVKKYAKRKRVSKQGVTEEQVIELHDQQSALVWLGKHHGLWKAKKENNNLIDVDAIAREFDILVGMTPEFEDDQLPLFPEPEK